MGDVAANPRPALYAATLLPDLVQPARDLGYALAVHGSLLNDLDIVAVPWTEDAASAERLIDALAKATGWRRCKGDPEVKPHGRRAWTLGLMGVIRLDVSVMPRTGPNP